MEESLRVSAALEADDVLDGLTPLQVGEPTLSMLFSINTSPVAGRDGDHVTSGKLKARLKKEALSNVSLRVEPSRSTDAYKVSGRGELQLAILIEQIRREDFELSAGRPEVVTRTIDGVLHDLRMRLVELREGES